MRRTNMRRHLWREIFKSASVAVRFLRNGDIARNIRAVLILSDDKEIMFAF